MDGEEERGGLLRRWMKETRALGNGQNVALRPLWMSVDVGGMWKSGVGRRTLGRQRRRRSRGVNGGTRSSTGQLQRRRSEFRQLSRAHLFLKAPSLA